MIGVRQKSVGDVAHVNGAFILFQNTNFVILVGMAWEPEISRNMQHAGSRALSHEVT